MFNIPGIMYNIGYFSPSSYTPLWLIWFGRIFIISIGLDILGSFILYVIKKVNIRFKKGKKKR